MPSLISNGMTVADCRLLKLPRIPDPRGNLSFIEGERHIPFRIARAYWIYDVPGGARRGQHAYRQLEEFMVALSGSFEVLLDDGKDQKAVWLNRGYEGLYVPGLVWRQLRNFSTNAVCLILASRPYDKEEYIRDYNEFLRAKQESDYHN